MEEFLCSQGFCKGEKSMWWPLVFSEIFSMFLTRPLEAICPIIWLFTDFSKNLQTKVINGSYGVPFLVSHFFGMFPVLPFFLVCGRIKIVYYHSFFLKMRLLAICTVIKYMTYPEITSNFSNALFNYFFTILLFQMVTIKYQ